MSDRTVTITFPPGEPGDLIQIRVHVDGVYHGDARESMGIGWEYAPAVQGGRTILYASFWELLTTLRRLPPGRVRPGLRVRIDAGNRRAALAAYAERGLTVGWPEYLAGWSDCLDREQQVKGLDVRSGESCLIASLNGEPSSSGRQQPESDHDSDP